MERELKRYRANSAYNHKEQIEVENKENLFDYNVLTEETSYRNRILNTKSSSINQQLQHHHLMNNSYKNLPKQVQSGSSTIQLQGNQFQDLYDKLKSDYTKLMIDFQKEQMECNNLRSQNKLDQKKLNELDKIVAEQQQEIVTLNNEIQLQLSQNHVLRDYLNEQEDRVTKITAENTNLTQELSSTRPTSLKNKSYTSITQQNELKYEQLFENKEYLERQIDQLQQQNSRTQHQNKELHEQLNLVKMQFCTLENHSQQLQRNIKQLELESSQHTINESLLQKSYQKLEEDYRKLEDKIKLMEGQCNNTIFWEETAKEFELKSLKMQEEQAKKIQNFKEMENYLQTIKNQFKDERERLVNEIKSYKKEIQLHREKNEMQNKNLQQLQKEYSYLKSQSKGYQNQAELIKNLKDTLVSIESSLSRETRLNEEKLQQIKGLEQQIDELKKQNNEKQEKIIKQEEQIAEINQRQQPILDTSQLNKDQSNNSTHLNETQLNYNSCNSNANKINGNGMQQIENQWELQDKIRKMEQTIFDLKNQVNNQMQPQQHSQQQQQSENTSFQQSYAPSYSHPKHISITNSPLHKNYLTQQYTTNNNANNNHNIHSYHNSSFNHSRPTIDLDRNQSHNNSFHYRKNSNDGASSFLGNIISGLYTNKNKQSQVENLQRKYEEIKSRANKNNQ